MEVLLDAKHRFFRDQSGLHALTAAIGDLPPPKGAFRVWVPTGSTAEDAYSIAIALLEGLAERAPGTQLRVFATGPDASAVARGRKGFYTTDDVSGLSRERLQRWFDPQKNGHRLNRELRESCIFTVHDLAEDLPVIHLDAIYCPAPLGDWEAPVRNRALDLFHFALKPGGLLLLIDQRCTPDERRFKQLMGKSRLFRRPSAPGELPREQLHALLGQAAKILQQESRGAGSVLDNEAHLEQDDFVAMVSHELRTPLAAILGFTETLNNGVRDHRKRKAFLNSIHKNAQRLLQTVESLVGMADSRTRQRQVARVDLSRAVRGALALQRKAARAASVTLRADIDRDLRATADAADIPHILENLIGNAIKYNKRGGHVLVTGGNDGSGVYVAVADTGVGIAKQSLDRVFDRFYRCPRNLNVKGSGLGLTVARSLAEANGGRINIDSTLGRGSTFTVTLPA